MQVYAPGKLVLAGEYAVVDGGAAIVQAVAPGVTCTVEPGAMAIDAPDDRFVGPALQAVNAPAAVYRFAATHELDLDGHKPGFGGSAAATVAAVLAGLRQQGWQPDSEALFRTSVAIHRSVQGSGSGVDVAASVFGGTIRFHGDIARPVTDVHPVVVWSGQSASTGPRVERYLAWGERKAFVEASDRVVATFEDDPVQALGRNRSLLAEMAEEAGVDWSTGPLDRIARLAWSVGGAAKPSGAGGGDCAVALFPSSGAEQRFRRLCAAEGLQILDCPIAPQGAHVR